MPFAFLLALGAVSVVILWLVDVDKSRIECRMYLVDEATRVYKLDPKAHLESTGRLDDPVVTADDPTAASEELRDDKAL